jgi:hypothetical protein
MSPPDLAAAQQTALGNRGDPGGGGFRWPSLTRPPILSTGRAASGDLGATAGYSAMSSAFRRSRGAGFERDGARESTGAGLAEGV